MPTTTFPLPCRVYSTELTTRFRGLNVRDGVLIEGPAGWAEVSPFWDYDIDYSATWLAAALESACRDYPAPLRDTVPINVTVPATDPERAASIAAAGAHCPAAKIKVAEAGQSIEDDLNRIAAVREVFTGTIRIDANGGWDEDTAIEVLPRLDRAAGGLEYCEQPVPTVAGLARVRRSVDVPIAADESIRRAEDPYEVARLDAADLIIGKVQPLGGIRACLRLIEDIGLPIVVSSALESSVGISAGVALAAALGTERACGLGTVSLFDRDVTSTPLLAREGHLAPGRVVPDEIPAAPPQVEAAWRERLDAMWERLRQRTDIDELTGGAL